MRWNWQAPTPKLRADVMTIGLLLAGRTEQPVRDSPRRHSRAREGLTWRRSQGIVNIAPFTELRSGDGRCLPQVGRFIARRTSRAAHACPGSPRRWPPGGSCGLVGGPRQRDDGVVVQSHRCARCGCGFGALGSGTGDSSSPAFDGSPRGGRAPSCGRFRCGHTERGCVSTSRLAASSRDHGCR